MAIRESTILMGLCINNVALTCVYFNISWWCLSTKTGTFGNKITNMAVMDLFFFYFLIAVYVSQLAVSHIQTKQRTWTVWLGKSCSCYSLIKAVPLEVWSGPEGSRKLRFPYFMTTARDVGRVVSLTQRPLFPQEMLLVFISIWGWVDLRAIVRSKDFMSIKNSNDTSCDRTSDLPICNTAP